jgi:hypothetical protein
MTEVNVSWRLGLVFEHDVMARFMEDLPWVAQTLQAHNLRRPEVASVISSFIDRLMDGASSPLLCLCKGQPLPGEDDNFIFEVMRSELTRAGHQTVLAPLSEVDADGTGLHHPAAGRIGLVGRLFGSEDYAVFADRERLADHVRNGRVGLLDGFSGEALASKILLAMLSEDGWQQLLPAELRATIRQIVPWTRIFRDAGTEHLGSCVNLPDFARANREKLVLKPGRGGRGVWVIIGKEVSQKSWESLLGVALRSKYPWIIQELVDPYLVESLTSPDGGGQVQLHRATRIANYACAVIDGKAACIVRREGDQGSRCLNTVQGARAVPVYVPDLPESEG